VTVGAASAFTDDHAPFSGVVTASQRIQRAPRAQSSKDGTKNTRSRLLSMMASGVIRFTPT
jgi:hypothetical protein